MKKFIAFATILGTLFNQNIFACDKSAGDIITESTNAQFSVCAYRIKSQKNLSIRFYSKHNNESDFLLLKNESAFGLNESISIEVSESGLVEIIDPHPKDTYSASFKIANSKVEFLSACKSINTEPPAESDQETGIITLCKEDRGAFTTQPSSNFFEKSDEFAFKPEKSSKLFKITSEKAYFYNEPNDDAITKTYLITGDIIRPIAGQGKWLNVTYTTKKNKEITKWIKIESIY